MDTKMDTKMDTVKFSMGPHKGRTYAETYRRFPDYIETLKKQSRPRKEMVAYLRYVSDQEMSKQPYQVQQLLGQGSFGRVFKVKETSTGTLMAAKVVIDGFDKEPDITPSEYDILFRICHPNIVSALRMLTCDEIKGVFNYPQWMIKTNLFTSGVLLPLAVSDLKSILKQDPRPGWFKPLDAAWQIACGLEALHAMGYLHLDLKPDNILYMPDKTYKISDFGLAVFIGTSSQVTLVSTKVTLTHRPPEVQNDGVKYTVNYATDVFSLGVVLNDLFMRYGVTWTPKTKDREYMQTNIEHITKGCKEWRDHVNGRLKLIQISNQEDKIKYETRMGTYWGGIGAAGILAFTDLIEKMISVKPEARGTVRYAREILQAHLSPPPKYFVLPTINTTSIVCNNEDNEIKKFIERAGCYMALSPNVALCAYYIFSHSSPIVPTDHASKVLRAKASVAIAGQIYGYTLNQLGWLYFNCEELKTCLRQLEFDPYLKGKFNYI
jgi:serine/threonine protein kinase